MKIDKHDCLAPASLGCWLQEWQVLPEATWTLLFSEFHDVLRCKKRLVLRVTAIAEPCQASKSCSGVATVDCHSLSNQTKSTSLEANTDKQLTSALLVWTAFKETSFSLFENNVPTSAPLSAVLCTNKGVNQMLHIHNEQTCLPDDVRGHPVGNHHRLQTEHGQSRARHTSGHTLTLTPLSTAS
jgi:hypothetical protein